MLGPGDLLGDRYRLDEFVASGGMGQVWRATDTVLNRTVAVKLLLPGMHADEEFGARFRAEARIMAALRHPGVAGVYDYGESTEGTMFLVMAFVEGRPLGELIAESGGLPATETMRIVAQAADALHAAHSNGIVHRDVKPGNLLVQDDGQVTLVDFGVARSTSVTSVTKVNAVIGTAMYMAPEQASGQPVSAASDIYALGAVAYHCLTGAPPFMGASQLEIAVKHLNEEPPPLPEDLPVSVRAVVERAMAKDPNDRFPTAAALAASARAAQTPTAADLAVAPGATAPVAFVGDDASGAGRGRGRRWLPVTAGAAVLAAIVGAVLVMLALGDEDARPTEPTVVPTTSSAPAVSTTSRAPTRTTGPRVTTTVPSGGSSPSVGVSASDPGGSTGPGTSTGPSRTPTQGTSASVPASQPVKSSERP